MSSSYFAYFGVGLCGLNRERTIISFCRRHHRRRRRRLHAPVSRHRSNFGHVGPRNVDGVVIVGRIHLSVKAPVAQPGRSLRALPASPNTSLIHEWFYQNYEQMLAK